MAAPPAPGERSVSVFVKYKADAPGNRLEIASGHGARFAYDLEHGRWLALVMPRNAAHAFDQLPWVEVVEVDTSLARLAGDVYPWGIDSSGARAVHSYARGNGVKIAFLDGGVRCTYADLTARVVGGYDFVAGTSTFCQNTLTATHSIEHGTYVAQVLAASVNGVDYVGMAPEAQLYNLRVCEVPPGETETGCYLAKIAAALDWARNHGIQVVSASIANCGQALPGAVTQAMNQLYSANIVQVWAGGNGSAGGCTGGTVNDPPAFTTVPGVIAVTGYISGSGYVPEYAHHSSLDIAAPTGVQAKSIFGGSGCCFNGTSASTPHVAGAAALMIGLGFTGVDLITQRLTTTAEDRGAAGFDTYYGYGVLNVAAAATRRPNITMLNGAPQPIKIAGTYPLSGVIAYGIAPIQVQWQIHYSNGVLPDVTVPYGPNSYTLDVPDGSYTITVVATPKESTYLRVGTPIQVDFPVCTGGGGGGGDLAPGLHGMGDVTPDAVGGCTP